jgi:hypothetical protein
MPIVYKDKNTGCKYTVVFADDTGALLHYKPANTRYWWSKADIARHLVEYKEPVVEKFTRVVLRSYLPGNVFTSNSKHIHTNEVIGSVEFIVTDGKLTDARVIDV